MLGFSKKTEHVPYFLRPPTASRSIPLASKTDYTTTDGTLDKSFDASAGKVITPMASGSALAYRVANYSSNQYVTAGYASNGSHDTFALAALQRRRRSLDTTFGTGGKVFTDFGYGAYGLSVLVSGTQIIVGGYAFNAGGAAVFALARYNSNGALDSTFGPALNGLVTTQVGSSDVIYRAGAVGEPNHRGRFQRDRQLLPAGGSGPVQQRRQPGHHLRQRRQDDVRLEQHGQ